MGFDMKDDTTVLQARILQLEQLLSTAFELRASQDADNLLSMEQTNAVLKDQVEALVSRARSLSRENDGLRIIMHSEHYAKPDQICVKPNLGKREMGIHGNIGFIVMPFSQSWSDSVHHAVACSFQQCGMECQRADELVGRNIILDIWTSICECAVLVVDITGFNPNVMYELGLAEAVGKNIILISQTTDPREIAFDILTTRLISYSLKSLDKLTSDIKKSLELQP
jgi:hypothetical protein